MLIRFPGKQGLLLSIIDLQSLAILACAATLLLGEPLKLTETFIILGIMLAVLVVYNIGVGPCDASLPSPAQLLRWTLPSQTLSVFSLSFVGIVVCLRYRTFGFVFLVTAVAYSACQQALYSVTFLKYGDISQALPEAAPWYLAVGFGKLLLGSIFYSLSFLILPSYPRLFSAEPPKVPEKLPGSIRKITTWTIASFVTPLVWALVMALVVEWFKK